MTYHIDLFAAYWAISIDKGEAQLPAMLQKPALLVHPCRNALQTE